MEEMTEETDKESFDTNFEEQQHEELKPIGKYLGERNTNNERHGKGWAIFHNGDQYDGEYRENQRHGKGLYVFKNGARYFGKYRCGLRSGQGTFYYPDGSIYDGNWRKNRNHGHGTCTYPNGDVYTGNWYKGQRHGLGTYKFRNIHCYFYGTWNNGVRLGPAEIEFANHKYHGDWNIFYPIGPGMYSFDCKYLNTGFYKIIENLHFNIMKNSDMKIEDQQKHFTPIWHSQNIIKYDFSKLPQQPIPLPLGNSSDESICDLDSIPSKKLSSISIRAQGEEGEEEHTAESSVEDSIKAA